MSAGPASGTDGLAVAAAYAREKSSTRVARAFRVSASFVLTQARRAGHVIHPPINPRCGGREERQAAAARYAGESLRQIGLAFGRHPSVVADWLRKEGVEIRPRGGARKRAGDR